MKEDGAQSLFWECLLTACLFSLYVANSAVSLHLGQLNEPITPEAEMQHNFFPSLRAVCCISALVTSELAFSPIRAGTHAETPGGGFLCRKIIFYFFTCFTCKPFGIWKWSIPPVLRSLGKTGLDANQYHVHFPLPSTHSFQRIILLVFNASLLSDIHLICIDQK